MLDLSQLTHLPRPAKTLILVVVDSAIGGVAFWLAALARVGRIPALPWQYMLAATAFIMVVVPAVGLACGLYKPVVRFHIPRLSTRAGLVSGLTGILIAVAGFSGGAASAQAIGLGVVFALILFVMLVVSRHEARLLLGATTEKGIPVAVYGAGSAGRQLVEVLRTGQERSPVLFIDDDRSLWGRTIEDLPVLNPVARHFKKRLLAKKVQEILLAIPSVNASRRKLILDLLGDLPFHVRSVPGISELANGKLSAVAQLKEVTIEDLLGREPVAPLADLLERCIAGKVVLVTGGGGSIGAELCRQVLVLNPARLIVLDHSEFALYKIQQELCEKTGANDAHSLFRFVLGSVTDANTIEGILQNNPVDTIYHAAAYKHVPIVEDNPVEGLRNNVLGTWYTARAAAQARVRHFVLVSSDKAVRPTNIMGATKRLSELVVQILAERPTNTIFSMVRFGNVLDSSGSVVPLFRKQIERGGPVTLTHPEVTRYFMTIHEAVQLVIQAGAMAKGGEVFVLDMGDPVKISELAAKMIHLSGRSTQSDMDDKKEKIVIEVVGLRPGEKLFEELLINGDATRTSHPRICQARENIENADQFDGELESIEKAIRENPAEIDFQRIFARWVDGYSNQKP